MIPEVLKYAEKALKWLKNILSTMGAVATLLGVILFFATMFQCERTSGIKKAQQILMLDLENVHLKNENSDLDSQMAIKDRIIAEQQFIIDSVKKEDVKKAKKVRELEKKLAQVPEIIEEIEPDSSYQALQTRYDYYDSVAPYTFNRYQIQAIHSDVMSLGIMKELAISYEDLYQNCKLQVESYDLLTKATNERMDFVMAAKGNTELMLANTEKKFNFVNKSAKGQKIRKHIWQGIAGAAVIYAITK